MGIVNIDEELHDQLRKASSVSCRSINGQVWGSSSSASTSRTMVEAESGEECSVYIGSVLWLLRSSMPGSWDGLHAQSDAGRGKAAGCGRFSPNCSGCVHLPLTRSGAD